MITARKCAVAVAAFALVGGSVSGALTVQSQIIVPDRTAEFEVASVKPALADNRSRGLIEASVESELARQHLADAWRGRFRTNGMSLHQLIQLAYDVRPFQIQAGPSWVRSERFAIEAAVAGTVKVDQVRAMLRPLLADRFPLVLHRDALTTLVYELIAAPSGLKIMPLKEGDCIPLNALSGPIPMDPAKPVYICDGYRRKILTFPPDR
jgi:uncharacterized protein (TIGR03435 family)